MASLKMFLHPIPASFFYLGKGGKNILGTRGWDKKLQRTAWIRECPTHTNQGRIKMRISSQIKGNLRA